MDASPDKLRKICGSQLGGAMVRRVNHAQKNNSNTEATPRNKTTCGNDATTSEATVTQAPMMANARHANNSHRDCICYKTPFNTDEVDTILRNFEHELSKIL